MERRRKYSRHFLQTMHTLLPPPPVIVVTQVSALLVISSLFLLVDYTEGIMTFPEESGGVYSLFPDEDLKTGRKRFRFEEETTRGYREREREGREYSTLVRSYPMLPHDRLHRPVADYTGGGGSRQVYDNYRDGRDRDLRDRDRDRHGRVYFDDSFRTNRFDFHRLNPRPRPIERPVSPIIFETSRRPPPPNHHHHSFLPDPFSPPPAIGQSKLPVGAATRASGEDNNNVPPTRIHVFNPDSVTFGNPRNAGGGGPRSKEHTSAERIENPPSNFVETGPPRPESFLNHEKFLEYQKKVAFSRFHEQDAGLQNGGPGGNNDNNNNGKKVLFESKEPFEIDGPTPPERSRETNSGKLLPTISKTHGHGQSIQPSIRYDDPDQIQQDQRQHQREQVEGQKVRPNYHHNSHPFPPFNNDGSGGGEERDTGGGEVVESDIVNGGGGSSRGKGEEDESENGKSEVRQLPPPTHITKSGRSHHHHQHSSSSSAGVGDDSGQQHGKKFTPSISHNENVGGGTGFKLPLPTTAILSYSGDDGDDDGNEPPRHGLHGFVPVVPFHLIGPEQPSLERQEQHRSTTRAPTTVRSTSASPTTAKVTKSGFRTTTEVFKSSSASPPSSFSLGPLLENSGNGGSVVADVINTVPPPSPPTIGSSPHSPILHATAGERSNSETSSKVAITKQQELKRLHKQRQQLSPPTSTMHQLTNSNPSSNIKSTNNNNNANSAANPHPSSHVTSSSSSSSSFDGLFPQISVTVGAGLKDDSTSSSDSADNSAHNKNHGTLFTNNHKNSFINDDDNNDDSSDNDTSSHTEDRVTSTATSTSTSFPITTFSTATPSTTTTHKDFNINTGPAILEQGPFHLHTISSTSTLTSSSKTQKHLQQNNTLLAHYDNNENYDKELIKKEQQSSTASSGGDSTIHTLFDSENNEIFDTRSVKTRDNGIRQGEFHLEGYMINGDGRSLSRSSLANRNSGSGVSANGFNSNNAGNNRNEENLLENEINYQNRPLYDYPAAEDEEEQEQEPHLPGGVVNNNVDNDFGTVTATPTLLREMMKKNDKDDDDVINDNNALSHDGGGDDLAISQFPGTTEPTKTVPAPDLELEDVDGLLTPSLMYNDEEGERDLRHYHYNLDESVVSGGKNKDYSSKHNETIGGDAAASRKDDDDLLIDTEPTLPLEIRQTRFSENAEEQQENNIALTSPNENNKNSIEQPNFVGFYPYYGQFGNKLSNETVDLGSKSRIGSGSGYDRSSFPSSSFSDVGGGEFPNDEKDTFEDDDYPFNLDADDDKGGSKSLRSSNVEVNSDDIIGNSFDDNNNNNNPSFISIPVEATLKTALESFVEFGSRNKDALGRKSGGSAVAVADQSFADIDNGDGLVSSLEKNFDNDAPLYLESSETLINKTYYLDGNKNDKEIITNEISSSPSSPRSFFNVSMKDGIINSLMKSSSSSNFIKVTRIKGSPNPSSKETVDKTLTAILATKTTSRTSKPAVVVSTSAAGLRPRVVGSVVEAGPAWPGLVSNFLRKNSPPPTPAYHNRSFTATATVRPRGSSGTNPPTRPTMIVSTGQVQKITLTPVPTTAALQRQIVLQPKQQHQQKQQQIATPTQFQLEQIRHSTTAALPSSVISSSKDIHGLENRPIIINDNRNPATTASIYNDRPLPNAKSSASTKSHQHIRINNNYNSSSSIMGQSRNSNANNNLRGGGSNLAKQVNSKQITNDDTNNGNHEENHPPLPPPQQTNNNITAIDGGGQAHDVVARRLYSFEEESSSSSAQQINNNNSSSGVVSLVHAHISHCPKLHSPTEVICDVHIKEGHGVPNPQLTVGWRRKFYNSTLPDVLLALNKAPASGENGHFDPHHSVMEVDPTKGERLEEFHDKFNVTLAPGISPMLRSVLLIRSVTAPDCGTYQCEVNDGINVLTSETLLFLCH